MCVDDDLRLDVVLIGVTVRLCGSMRLTWSRLFAVYPEEAELLALFIESIHECLFPCIDAFVRPLMIEHVRYAVSDFSTRVAAMTLLA